jgi:hypothetical protein
MEGGSALPSRLIDNQVLELQTIDRFIGVKDEYALHLLFDFHRIFVYNVKHYRDEFLFGATPQRDTNEIEGVFAGGEGRADSRYSKFLPAESRIELLPGKIDMIKLTAQYVQNRNELASMIRSAATPTPVISALQEFDQAVENNTLLIFEVLNERLADDQQNITDEPPSPRWSATQNLYWSRFIPLRPYAERITAATREYLKVK